MEQDKRADVIPLCGGRIRRKINIHSNTRHSEQTVWASPCRSSSKTLSGFSLHDSGDVKAEATLESCVYQKKCWHFMAVGIRMSKCNNQQILKTNQQHFYKVKCLDAKWR